MVKRIFFGAIILLMLMNISFAENDTLIDSYSYDFVAEGTSAEIIGQIDSDEKTVITLELNTTPGEIEVSAILGTTEYNDVFFTEGSEVIDLEFNKMVPGTKELLLMIYNEEELVAFITNYEVQVSNNIVLEAVPESAIIVDDELYVTFDVITNLNISDSNSKIISDKGTVYQSTKMSSQNNKVTYVFSPKETAQYSLYEIEIEGYVQEFNNSLGRFDLSPISNFKESKTDEGLLISFNSDCTDCEKEIMLFSEEDEYVYGEKITSNSLVVPSDIINAMEINGPYKVIITFEDVDYEFMTQTYNYGDFETETTPEETSESSGSDEEDEMDEGNETVSEMNETSSNMTETMEDQTPESNESTSMEDSENMTGIEDLGQEITEEVEETGSNLVTGLSISNLKDYVNDKKTIMYSILGAIVVIGILGFVYIRQRKDAYLYEM